MSDEETEESQPDDGEGQGEDEAAYEVAQQPSRPLTPKYKVEDLLRYYPAANATYERRMQDLSKRMSAQFSSAVKPTLDAYVRDMMPKLDISRLGVLPKLVLPQFDPSQLEAFRQLVESIERLTRLPAVSLPHDWFPASWEDLTDEELDVAMAIVRDEGIPLVWVSNDRNLWIAGKGCTFPDHPMKVSR